MAPIACFGMESIFFSVYVLLLFILFLIIFCLIPVHGIIGFLNGIHNVYGIGYPLTTCGNGQIPKVGCFIPQPFQLTGKFAFGYMLEQYYKFISAKAVHMVCAIESHQKTGNGTKSCISCQMPFRVIDYLQPIHINKDNPDTIMRLPQPQHFITVSIPVINPCQSITAPEMFQFMNEMVISNPGPQEKRERFQKF